jgi:hypothetical protein
MPTDLAGQNDSRTAPKAEPEVAFVLSRPLVLGGRPA